MSAPVMIVDVVGDDDLMRLLFLRHGQTPSNVAWALDTAAPGADLNDLGRRQADAVPGGLVDERIGALYASSLVRAQQTAAPLARARGLDLRIHPGLREIAAGDLEMRTDKESLVTYLETVFSWPEGDLDRRIPGGESGAEVLARVDGAVEEIAATGHDNVVCVSHGAVIRVWAACRAHNVEPTYAMEHWLPNTGLVVLEGTPGGSWSVTTWLGHAVGGIELSDVVHTGPTGEPESVVEAE